MLPITTRTAQGRQGVLMSGDYVEITACRCNPPHGRYGIIFQSLMPQRWSKEPTADFVVLLAGSPRDGMAEYCRPLELRPAREDDIANAIPRHRERPSLVIARS